MDHALGEIYDIIKNKKTIIFVNTRAQCEILYKNLFLAYPDLKIGIYHGSLSKNIRMETEKKFKVSDINCVVSTSSLEMGIDWKNIDKIINIGAPKSVNKIIQRTGSKSMTVIAPVVHIPYPLINEIIRIIINNAIKIFHINSVISSNFKTFNSFSSTNVVF